jgi:hypothetical protein
MPGAGDMACPYWYVLDKEKLSGADLYYVDGVMTSDGSTYSPWCALQDSSGILQNQSSVDYLLFMGKNNSYTISGETVGTSLAGLRCDAPVGENTIMTGTKAEATAFLATTAAKQAKLILLSAHY